MRGSKKSSENDDLTYLSLPITDPFIGSVDSKYGYKIFSILSSARVILVGKSDSRRHSATGFGENVVAGRKQDIKC